VLRAARRSGFRPLRATHAFAAVFPAFAAQRALEQLTERRSKGPRPTAADPVKLAPVSAGLQRLLLWLCRLDERALGRHELAFGSSILLAAQKPAVPMVLSANDSSGSWAQIPPAPRPRGSGST
jgi:hypothetical protein